MISRNRARTKGSRMRRSAQKAAPVRMTVEMTTQTFTVADGPPAILVPGGLFAFGIGFLSGRLGAGAR